MSSFNDLEIFQEAHRLAVMVHRESLKLPKFELCEQGSQIRRSTKTIKDTIAEGYGRKKYKPEFIKFLIYAQSSCDEVLSQLGTLKEIYDNMEIWTELEIEYQNLGKRINSFIKFVENHWNEPKQ